MVTLIKAAITSLYTACECHDSVKSYCVNINNNLSVKLYKLTWILKVKWTRPALLKSLTVTEVNGTISSNTIKQDLHPLSAASYLIVYLLSANEGS